MEWVIEGVECIYMGMEWVYRRYGVGVECIYVGIEWVQMVVVSPCTAVALLPGLVCS